MEAMLKQWGLEEYIETFEEEGVDLQVLLNEKNKEILSNLIPKLGKRLMFLRKLEDFIAIQKEQRESIDLGIDNDISAFSEIASLNNTEASGSDFIIIPFEDSAGPSTESYHSRTQIETEEEPLYKKQKTLNNFLADFDLKSVLCSSAIGKGLLAWYNLKGGFDTTRQSYLVDIISSDFINRGYTHLKNNEYKILSEKIVSLFPLEITETYYLHPTKKRDSLFNKSGVAKGKLVDKFRNKLTFLREAGILPTRSKENAENDSTVDESVENGTEDVNWLRDNREPLQEVYGHWDNCFRLRRQNILKESDLPAVFLKYPILKEPVCLSLVERDYEKIFPKKIDIKSCFENVFAKLAKLRGNTLSSANDKILMDLVSSDSIQEDYKHYVMLLLLSSLIPNKARHIFGRSRKHWKPSVADARNGIVIKADVPGDVEIKIKEKIDKLTAVELPVQPFLVVVGPGINVQKIYVYINQELYPVGSILRGLDVCFKSYHVFHIRYQLESEYVWLFIQLCIYDIKSKWDIAIPGVLDIANKVKRL